MVLVVEAMWYLLRRMCGVGCKGYVVLVRLCGVGCGGYVLD